MKNLLISLFILLLSTVVSNADWTQTNETHYLYVGGTVIQERSSNNTPLVTYTLGHGLLARTDITNGIPARLVNPNRLKGTGPGVPNIKGTAFYHHDGNNNITAMIRSNSSVVAQYTYDPYGGIVSKSGIMSDINTYRFASKEINPLAGIYAYHFRFYDPSIKRWINQDPIGLFGGRNVFSFVKNDPINRYDPLGLSPLWSGGDLAAIDFENAGYVFSLMMNDIKNTWWGKPIMDTLEALPMGGAELGMTAGMSKVSKFNWLAEEEKILAAAAKREAAAAKVVKKVVQGGISTEKYIVKEKCDFANPMMYHEWIRNMSAEEKSILISHCDYPAVRMDGVTVVARQLENGTIESHEALWSRLGIELYKKGQYESAGLAESIAKFDAERGYTSGGLNSANFVSFGKGQEAAGVLPHDVRKVTNDPH